MARFITLSSGVSRIRFKEGEGAVYFEKGRKGDSEIMACRNHNRRGRGSDSAKRQQFVEYCLNVDDESHL